MSHTDRVKVMPSGFEITAKTEACPIAAYENEEKKIYGVQFHPEVTHTQFGFKILHNFLYNVCGCHGDWKMDSFIDDTVKSLREKSETKRLFSAFRAVSIPRSRRDFSLAPSANSSPAFLLTRDLCVRTRAISSKRRSLRCSI